MVIYCVVVSYNVVYCCLVIVFGSAQKLQVPIDAMVYCATEDSSFLQQACFHTAGCYHRLVTDQKSKSLPLLLMHALPNRPMRSMLKSPSVELVNFSALCSCHGKLQSEALMCSVCLTITCQPSSSCRVSGNI